MSYVCKIACGGEVVDQEEFDTQEEASQWGNEWLGDNAVGQESLELLGRDYIDADEYDYTIE